MLHQIKRKTVARQPAKVQYRQGKTDLYEHPTTHTPTIGVDMDVLASSSDQVRNDSDVLLQELALLKDKQRRMRAGIDVS